MRKLAALILASCLAVPAAPAAKKGQSSSRKKSSSKTRPAASKAKASAKKPAAPKAASAKTTKKKSSASSKRRRTTRASWRSGQMTPTPERYAQIQQALIDKGYLAGTATGSWGADSTEALRKFQQDQNLDPTGKLDSLTLISLGLGPRREISAVPAPATPNSKPNPRGQQ